MSEWQARALCAGDLAFIDLPHDRQAETCRDCPVRVECLELGVSQAGGTVAATIGYAGLTAVEMTRIARGRRQRRPVELRRCAHCGVEFVGPRSRLYCAGVCRWRAYEARQPRSARKRRAVA